MLLRQETGSKSAGSFIIVNRRSFVFETVSGSVRAYSEMLCGFYRIDVRLAKQELSPVAFLLIFNHSLNSEVVIEMI